MIEAMPDIVIRMDTQGGVFDVKSGALDASPATITDRGARAEILVKHVNPGVAAAVGRAVATQQVIAIEYPVEAAGAVQHFEARIAPVLGTQAVAFIRDITDRKRAEEELFASREMLRTILDTIPQRVFWKDTQSVYLGCNQLVAEDFGLAASAEIVGKTDFETDAKEIAELYRRADDQQVLRSDQPKLNYEEPQKRSDGAQRWLRTSKVPLHDASGRVIGVLGTYEDITERKQTEALHAGQNRVLEMIIAGVPLLEVLTRLAQIMESLSHGMLCTVLLVDPDGQRLRSYVAPSLPDEFSQAVDGLPIGEGFGSCGTAAARKAPVVVTDARGHPLWARYAEFVERFGVRACWSIPIMSSGETLLGTFAMYFQQPRSPTVADLRLINVASHLAGLAIQRSHAEKALRRAEDKYRNIFENALDGIFQITPEGRILEANPAFARMFGFESAGALIASVTHVGEQLCVLPARYAEFVQALQTKGVVQRWELPMRHRNEQALWVSLDARLACAADGQTLCYEGIAKDITERKRLEPLFLQTQKMEAFGQLAGGVAHDFNNLLTVILGNLSMIRLGDLPPEHRQASLDDCFRAAERAANLTSQLLTFSRRNRIEPRDLDLNEVVLNVAKILRRLIGEHIVLEMHPASGDVHVRADSGMMEQAVTHLALNSRDAMLGGGTLRIAITAVDRDVASLGPASRGRPGRFVRLSVSDTGSGIAPEHLPHIFEPFFTTKGVSKGTGLGLAMVFGIVEQHEGWIEVESEPRVGTTMHVFMPRVAARTPPSPAPLPADPPRGGAETVLVVEDEADVRTMMCKLLERQGYRVHAAANGPDALVLWQRLRGSIDLLVTDMVMPGGLNGRQLAEQLLADKPALRIIVCSGYSDEVLALGGPLRRRENFLGKPFDVHVFLQRVRECLDAKD